MSKIFGGGDDPGTPPLNTALPKMYKCLNKINGIASYTKWTNLFSG